MNWSDVTAAPSRKTLRQFGGLSLVVFGALAGWRVWQGGGFDARAAWLSGVAGVVGIAGLVYPPAVRWIYTGWMLAVFPIGWTVSRLMVAALFYLLFTPVALIFRLIGRDHLRLRRPDVASYWTARTQPTDDQSYFRQS